MEAEFRLGWRRDPQVEGEVDWLQVIGAVVKTLRVKIEVLK